MITFNQMLTIKKLEHKHLTTKAGKPFNFIEAICATDEDKPTYLVARIVDGMEEALEEGTTAIFKISISSYEGKDGRIWNNFTLVAKEDVVVPAAEESQREPLETILADDLPF